MKEGTWIDRVTQTIIKAIDTRIAKPTGSYVEKGKVLRVDKALGLAWVHIHGGEAETPVKLTIDAKTGDTVQVRVGEGSATIIGNLSHPPTDDAVANAAAEEAAKALKKANEANAMADNASIKAENSIASDTPHYLATSLDSGVTKDTPGWTDTIQTMTEVNRYLWTYHTYTLINGNTTDTDPIIIGIYGDTGTSVAGVIEWYLATSASSGVTRATAGWTTTMQSTTTTNKYLWNYEQLTDAGGNIISETDPVIIGTHGATGESVASIVEYYLATSLSSGVTTSTPGWTTTVQSTTSTNKYLWNYEKVYGSLGTLLNTTTPVIIGTHGEDGSPGGTGPQGVSVTAVEPQYYLSTSSSAPVGGSWTSTLTYASGYYIWTREKISYDNNTTTYSTAIYNQALTEACSLSANTAQYFWTKDSGGTTACPTGTYVTEVPRANYDPSLGGTPTLGSVLIRSGEIYIRAAAVTMLQVLAAGLTMFNSSGKKLAEYLSSGQTIYDGDDHEIAHLGYGPGNAESGTSNAPYFTFGSRRATTNSYSSGTTYSYGDMVLYNSNLYVYKSHTSGSGHAPTSTTYWERAVGNCSAAIGTLNVAAGYGSIAEGGSNTVTGGSSHVEGKGCEASGEWSHAGGYSSKAQGDNSLAHGFYATASGYGAAAFGSNTEATDDNSVAFGDHTKASHLNQVAMGKYNEDKSGNLFEVGYGTSSSAKKNVFEVSNAGNVTCTGKVTAGNIKTIDCGDFTPTSNIPAGSYQENTVPFNITFANPPTVVICLESSSSNQDYKDIQVMIEPGETTTAQFKYYTVNGSNTARKPGIRWVAIG